jgi:UDP-3-O-[3-hydroxymyristoyl] glucosamine N-acyltransferase
MICGQVGIAGSCSTGDYVVMGGQVGLKDHLKIGAGAQLAAQSGLIKDLPPGARVFGTPAIDAKEELRLFVLKQRLPQLFKTISTLAETVDSLNERIRMLEARSACEASKTPEHDRT